jgi:hypothetical protein
MSSGKNINLYYDNISSNKISVFFIVIIVK